MPNEHQWQTAILWVQSNDALVRHVASPYSRYMASGSKDIEQEAILTAFCTLEVLKKKRVDESRLGAYFRVNFRTRCIRMATGIAVSSFANIDQIPAMAPDLDNHDLDHSVIEQALQGISSRQRLISRWILEQQRPVSTTIVASEFGICSRTVRAIISNAVKQIKERDFEDTRLRQNISIAA